MDQQGFFRPKLARIRRWCSEMFQEFRSRRRGRAHAPNEMARAARDITGPLGSAYSGGYQRLGDHWGAYVKSFDRHLPPSIHISERDRLRHGQVIPVSERAISDWKSDNRTTDPR